MMAFPTMLVAAAEQAGIAVPPDVDTYDKEQFPHFYFLCATQLGRPMRHGEHWDNAKTVAELSVEQVKSFTYEDCVAIGVM